jgi:simple sugar transport system permease protein
MTGWRAALLALGAVGGGLLILMGGLAALGYDAPTALGALWRGAFGSWYAFGSATLVRAVPLIVIGLGIAIGFRAGALNIGAEGQFAAGAVAATWVGLQAGGWPGPVALLAVIISGGLAGAAWVAIPVWLRLRHGVLEVISTLLLNFVAEAAVSFVVQGPLQEAKGVYPQSDPIPAAARLPLLPGSRLHLGFLIAVFLAIGVWVVFRRTRWGFQLRAVGEAPRAAAVTGRIEVARMMAAALLLSGGLAGLAGAFEVSGVTFALYQNLSPGYGFTAIAVALIARLNPIGVVVAGLGFGALEAGAAGMQREAGVPAVGVAVVQAVVIVIALIGVARARSVRAAAAV